MRVLTLVTQKGGAGKTTVALNLALAAEEQGCRALILDLDPQRTATEWYEARDAKTPLLAEITSDQLEHALGVARDTGADLVLIDTPGRDAIAVNKAIKLADFALIPCQPSLIDIRAQRRTIDVTESLATPAAFVLTRSSASGKRADHAGKGLQGFGIPVAPVSIVNRIAYPDAYALNQGVTEYEPEGKAAQEIRALWEWTNAKMDKLLNPVVPHIEEKTA